MDYLVSIIIPAYNIEKYIYDCLKSIQRQTYSKIEVVIVNDGSTDSTGAICDDFCKDDHRFSVIHQDNHGQAHARNIARSYIHGAYLTYIDGDDIIHPDMIRFLTDIQKQTLTDVVQGTYSCFFDTTYNSEIVPIMNKCLDYHAEHIEIYLCKEIHKWSLGETH